MLGSGSLRHGLQVVAYQDPVAKEMALGRTFKGSAGRVQGLLRGELKLCLRLFPAGSFPLESCANAVPRFEWQQGLASAVLMHYRSLPSACFGARPSWLLRVVLC